MKKVALIFLSFFFITAIPAFADTSGGYGGTNVTVINASAGEVEIQNLQCSAYNSFQLRLSSGGSDLASGGTCSQNGSNADVTWSSYDFNAHGVVSNYIIAESFSTGTDWSNTFSYSPTGGTNGGYGGTNVSVINASSGEVEIQNLQCSAYNSFQLQISGNNNYGDLASGGTCSQNGSNADVTWSSWDFNAHGAVSNYIIAESFTFGTDFSNAFSYHSYAGTNVSVINASSGEVEIQNLVCSAYQSFQLRLDSGGSDLATGGTCSQNGSNADVTWSSYNFNAHGAISNYIVAESGSYGTDFSNTFSYTPPNQPPSISSIGNTTINEGDTYSANGSFTDPDSSSWTATVDYGDGAGAQSLTLSGTNFSLSHTYKDNGTYTVTVSVTDNQGATGTGTATITVNNVVPTVGAITAPSSPVLVNTATTASANFTDPGVLDTHTASWNWGDGNTTTGTVTESNGSGSVSNNHTYTATGVYTITLTVTDKDGGVGTSTFQYVAVYDSSTSFAGGRSFDNPTGASPNTTGKVSFGISSKYSNNTLTGSVKMNFKAANLDFASTSLSSLATANGKAYLKGSGTLNGNSGYTFLASGIDGSVVGGNDLIRFQIKDSSNNVVYDSQPGAGDTIDPTTSDATGNIRVH